jgi:hypothetical protein
MGGYVKLDKDLRDDDRVAALTDHMLEYWVSLGVPAVLTDALRSNARNAVMGGLYALWRHADTYLQRDDRLGGALRHLSDVTGLPVTLLKKFPRQWLIEHPDGTFELPGYSSKNSLLNKDERREGARERQARFRQRKREERNASRVTQRNAQERDTRVTTGTGTGTGPGTLPTIPVPGPRTESGKPQSASAGELASATGRLARRDAKSNGKHPAVKTREQLDLDIDRLAGAGMASADIAHALAQHGVTTEQVTARLANRQRSEAARESKSGEGPQ